MPPAPPRPNSADPEEPQAGQEELREPHRRHHHGHAEIGLLDQHADDQHEQSRWRSSGRGSRASACTARTARRQTTAKHGLTNSEGWSESTGSSIQRRAPLISTPTTKVSASSTSEMTKPITAMRRMSRGLCSDTSEHHRDRHRQQREIAAHEMQAVDADALGDGRARRHHDRAEADQHAERGKVQRSTVHHHCATRSDRCGRTSSDRSSPSGPEWLLGATAHP